MTAILLVILIAAAGFSALRGYEKRLKHLEAEVRRLERALAGRPASGFAMDIAAAPDAPLAEQDIVDIALHDPRAETDAGVPLAIEEPASAQPASEPLSQAAVPAAQDMATITGTGEKDASASNRAESLESRLGARWAVWVGGLALALGGIFMVKYSIESGILSPAVRLTMASLFGLALIVAGEFVRRRATPLTDNRFHNAMIPGVLTAAGAVSLFGATYAAHGIYGFIGPSTAFLALSAVALATLGLSLMHGQALAGLGLLGSMATPLLVASAAPNIWALFGLLSVAWLATACASRLSRWTVVPALANTGMALWAIFYVAGTDVLDLVPVTLALLVMIGGAIFLWPGTAFERMAAVGQAPEEARTDGWQPSAWEMLLARPPLGLSLTVSLAALAAGLAMALSLKASTIDPMFSFAAVAVTLAALGASRTNAALPAIIAAAQAIAGAALLAVTSLYPEMLGFSTDGTASAPVGHGIDIAIGLGLGAIFAGLGFAFLRRYGRQEPQFSAIWSAIMTIVPIANGAISFVNFGNLSRDWTHGLYGITLGVAYLAIAQWLSRRQDKEGASGPMHWLIAGSFAAFTLALHSLTHGAATTIGVAVIGFTYVAATRLRPWPALPFAMAAASIIVLGRIAWDPTIVGADHLGTTPVFNALLAGYGIPALLAALSAYELRHWPDRRIRNVMQALASLMGLLTVAILVRHAMNGGSLAGGAPTLAEQSIYTLIAIGGSAILMALDTRTPSPALRYGSMIAGAISMLSILFAHFVALNPFLTGENTGNLPFFNLLLIGYLLPGFAFAAVALYARDKRPRAYVILLALSGAALGFAWATLSVRRFWQGQNIADWKGFFEGETYSYSVVWLVIGVALLALGSRFDAKSLRLTSAALVLIAVVKVFLVDMANLEGFLRALSFIGLGAVLIGIGLFYQKILTGKSAGDTKSGGGPARNE